MCEQIFSGPQNYCANMETVKGNRDVTIQGQASPN